ncbi:protease HtpX [Alkalilimnicola ehrlichii MLHE-1]|uniref:Protease HtpX n=1 Tax=Alkalilimnicola ehrlichii (strain ATCC BAA-1101 / DSM 17681 / MLHE-1) TaxID=187272 RepID=HTPX_ALKEH|nr:protease HtpX [Alkalilimnicola ehrlichii]Q0AAR8.1 RecName: Full=Protease HtpX; AltName: Full=Heat shock protein HtpX [Alkalilimnicola ehrlichii MLHE-1]ABI56069.1 Heat shock protein [Alkalilimnicola ehrlichii MLHE-1]
MKRIGLFLLTNLAILVVLGVVLFILQAVFGVRTLDEAGVGLDYTGLLIIAAVIGFGGSFISLAMSKFIAKRMTGARVIEKPRSEAEQWLVDTVRRFARQEGIGMPEVAIYDAPDMNAFATGARRNNSLVAVSTGLLQSMTRDEAEAVIGHEIAHISNGDMVTLTLIQGVVNTFVVFFSRIIGHFVDRVVFKTEQGHGPAYFITSIFAQIVLGILASVIVMWFSRQREYRADAGGAKLAGRDKMIAALERLKRSVDQEHLPDQLEAFGINGNRGGGMKEWFMSHPPLDDRIAALKEGRHLRG